MDAILQLAVADLTTLAAAIRSGRLDLPFSDISVRRYYRGHKVSEVVACFERLVSEGMSASHIALLLNAILTTRLQYPTPVPQSCHLKCPDFQTES